MKIIRKQLVIFFAIFIIFITSSLAHEYKVGNLKILHPYITETPPGAKISGGYMKIVNTGNQTDHLSLVTVDFAKALIFLESPVIPISLLLKTLK